MFICKDEVVLGKRKYLLIGASLLVLTIVAACTENQVPTQTPVEFSPTEAVAVERADTADPEEEKAAPPAQEVSAGDSAAGQALFNSAGCSGCHSTGDNKILGPGLAGLYDRAGSLTSLDAEAYIEESLREPKAFVVDGFPPVMPSYDRFSDGEMQDMIAFMKTLK